MKIFIVCSKHFYSRIPAIQKELEEHGHTIIPPNSYEEPFKEEEMKKMGVEEHRAWKANMIRLHEPKVRSSDCLLVLNFEKKGQKNYIGGATFLEIYKAFELGKRVYLYNPIPENIFEDELKGMGVEVILGDLKKIIP